MTAILFTISASYVVRAAVNSSRSAILDEQWVQYQAPVAKTIIELQPFRRSSTIAIKDGTGRKGIATLVELQPNANAWWLLTLKWSDGTTAVSYHLENPYPRTQFVSLDPSFEQGVLLSIANASTRCALWTGNGPTELERAKRSGLPFAPLCDDRLYLRNVVSGTYTKIELITNFLRDRVWGGDQIVGFVRKHFFQDAYLERGKEADKTPNIQSATGPSSPNAAELNATSAFETVIPEHLGIDLGESANTLLLGRWYGVPDATGVFVSVIQPRAILDTALHERLSTVNTLDAVETEAMDYLVAMDLSQFDLGFSVGTDHPRVGWSERVPEQLRDKALPGPDGISDIAPLAANGMLNPLQVSRAVATFAGGFKREHGAFLYGPLAEKRNGTHYGFIEQGTIFSKLQPELSTLYVTNDGSVEMKTWTVADDTRLEHVRYARQNGVPLIDYDATTARSFPGSFVNKWGAGNWSGSSDEKLRSLRAGVCLQVTATRRFLIYGYFSTATPSAMARVFRAYGCRYAMHLDMNALEHTYFALYTHKAGSLVVQHLIEGMEEVDRKGGNQLAPRFLSFPDDRDFFYLLRREKSS
jgi:hypothetical protein